VALHRFAHRQPVESARGLAHSKTLSRRILNAGISIGSWKE
jgi:hypothetical protein